MSEQTPTTADERADETPVLDVLAAMTAASLERTTRTPSSSPRRRYISRQKSAIFAPPADLKMSINGRSR